MNYEYKHTSAALVLLSLFIFFIDSAVVGAIFAFGKDLGYIGAFIGGLFTASFFTAVPAIVLLVSMAPNLDPFAMAIVAGAGSMVGDWLLLSFIGKKVFAELKPLFLRLKLSRILKKLRHPSTHWLLFVFGGFTIASPLPDEIGLAMLGVSHFKPAYILALCFVLNSMGLLAVILATRALAI